MVIVSLYGGLVSQIRAFYIGYKLIRIFKDEIILDLSQYYNGYYRPYILDFMNIPNGLRIATRGTLSDKIKIYEKLFGQKIHLIEDGEDLENVYSHFDSSQIYYIINDCCFYDSFCRKHDEFFFRYIGSDSITNEIMDMIQLSVPSSYLERFESKINCCESVGVHIRLGDFIKIGWITEHDYDYYRAAIQWCREKINNPKFFIFSDDIDNAKKILGDASDINYIESNFQDLNDIEQILCLSKCRHRILSKKSGFSLFAATVARNKWKIRGYSLIIDQIHLSENASDKEYVDWNFNKFPLYKWEDNLSNCVKLKENEILTLNNRYIKKQNFQCNIVKNVKISLDKRNMNAIKYIFFTLQIFSKTKITGMERMAKYLAELGNDVHFVGEKEEPTYDKDSNDFQWTIRKAKEAKDMNENSLKYTLYPYVELNQKNNYLEFLKYIHNLADDIPTYVITRKKKGLPLLKYHKNNLKFIFIDFSDEYEEENAEKLLNEELKYLYENADLVITFEENIYNYYRLKNNRIIYIKIKDFFPDIKIWDKKIDNLDEINKCEDKLYQYLNDRIRRFFYETR